MTDAVTSLCEAIETGTPVPDGVFTDDAVVDATVPNWRFAVHGDDAIRAQFAQWFADKGRFEELVRTSLPDGELIEFTLFWEECGKPFACHQAHVIRTRDGRIASDTLFCGGRWPAELLAEMGAAAHAG
jgi:ketosteroid isomerase-like protein